MQGEGQVGISLKSAVAGWKFAWAYSPVRRWLLLRWQPEVQSIGLCISARFSMILARSKDAHQNVRSGHY